MFTLFSRTTEGFYKPSNANLFHFPAGEAMIGPAEDPTEVPAIAFVQGADPDDLIMLAMAADYANQKGNGLIALFPYLPGARADRGFPFGAKVYANLINAMNLKEIICFDPHSPVITNLLHRVTVLDTVDVITRTVLNGGKKYAGVISPDEGSRTRSGLIAKAAGIPLVNAGKHRDFATGKLSGFWCDELPDPEGTYILIDDIADGAGTFMGLAKEIDLPKEQFDIWVSHGVFSGKAPGLRDYFGEIWTTNSHPGATREEVGAHVVDILPYLMQLVN